jgi:hypothetical protein
MRVSNLSSLTGLVKAVIYLAFIGALLAIVYVFGSFIYVMAHADDLSKVNMTNLYRLPELAKDQGAGVWEATNGGIRFRLHQVYGEFSYLNMPRGMVLAIFFRLFVQVALFLIGTVQMANIFEDVSAGKPFVLENARRLRTVGYCMAGGAIFTVLAQTGTMLLYRNEIMMRDASFAWYWYVKSVLNPGLLFGGLIVIVISEVFRLGNKLQEEQELTV